MEAVPVKCPSCDKEFCSLCSANWHPGLTCAQNGNALFASASSNKRTNSNNILTNTSASNNRVVGPFGDAFAFPGAGSIEGDIKRCPMCNVPIERDAGCAQMMCKRCKHVFCWFCLTSLDVSIIESFHLGIRKITDGREIWVIKLYLLKFVCRKTFYFGITTPENVKGS